MTTVRLSQPPRTGGLLLRAAVGAVNRRRAAPGDALPDTELVLPEQAVDRDHLGRYSLVCGFGTRDELPATYPHVLAFPLAMSLLSRRDFPFALLGLVHVGNTITQLRPLRADELLTVRVRVADLRPHDRGQQFDVVHTAVVGGEAVWRDVSTYLRRSSTGSSRSDGSPAGSSRPDRAAEPPPAPSAVWRVGRDLGRRYAAVSGDRNPIHLSALTARAFGFRRAIAHGMWTKARCLAGLEGRLPDAFTVMVAFKQPVLLPSTVAFSAAAEATGWRFAVHHAGWGRPHLAGAVTEPQPTGS